MSLIALLAACHEPTTSDEPQTDADADSDTDADSDADADADSDADTDLEHTGTWEDTGTGPQLPDDGYLTVVWVKTNTEQPQAYLIGEVYTENAPGVSGVAFRRPHGPDDCRLTRYTLEQLSQGSLPDRTAESAGALTLTSPTSAPRTIPLGGDGSYYATLDAGTVPFGQAWSVSAPGASFPAFDAPDGIGMPAARTLSAPSAGFSVGGDLELAWTGGDGTLLTLTIEATGSSTDRALIQCSVIDDGAFAVPAALTSQLPGGRVSVRLDQSRTDHLEVDGRWLRLTGSVVDVVVGSAP
ncbi:MAG: hypothetical protein KC621_01415 [Myxococcales bacterium]|nr:hypothetical protein [Myxococcales bacterium]